MKVLVIYCHPSNKSFTARMKDEFIRGLEDGGHTCQLIDLYQINFDETFSEEEYLREAFYDYPVREVNYSKNLKRAYLLGKEF